MPLPYATPANVKNRLGITGSGNDALLSSLCEEANAEIEGTTHRAIGSSSVSNQIIDGFGIHIQSGGYVIDYPPGVRSISTLELRLTTDGSYSTIPSSDYFIRPEEPFRTPGWPGFAIHLTDLPSSGNEVPSLHGGFAAVRLTAEVGWARMPSDLRGVAEVGVARAWRGKEAGYQDDQGVDELGEQTISRWWSSREWRIIRRYAWKPVEVID